MRSAEPEPSTTEVTEREEPSPPGGSEVLDLDRVAASRPPVRARVESTPRRPRQRWTGGSRRARVAQVVVLFVAALLPRLLSTGRFLIGDSMIWQIRTDRFTDAMFDGRFSDATASHGGPATMPGGTTMWLGLLSRQAHGLAEDLGLAGDSEWSRQTYHQVAMAVATAALVVLIAVLTARWAGWGAGAVAGVVLATEPWLGAHGAVTQTDALTSMFGIAGLLALAVAFDVPSRGAVTRPLLAAAAAGALVAASPLTKISGAAYGVGAAAVVATSLVLAVHRRRSQQGLIRLRLLQLAGALGGAAAATVALWPALPASPDEQFSALMDSVALASDGHTQFYRGEITTTPGSTFYAVALPLRVTPWLLVASLVAIPIGIVNRSTRARVLWTLGWALPPTIAFSAASKQMDRYGLMILIPLVVAAGVAVGPHLERLLATRPPVRAAAAAVAVLVTIHAVAVSPYGLLYFNPLLGGSERATETLMVGWGEGTEVALEQIRHLEGGDCTGVTVSGVRPNLYGAFPLPASYDHFGFDCARRPAEGRPATYVIAYVNQTQRVSPMARAIALDGREKVGEVEIRGIEVATIWR